MIYDYKNGLIDTNHFYSINYKFDKKELIRIYQSLYHTVRWFPWRDFPPGSPRPPGSRWSKRGWWWDECLKSKTNPDHEINKFEYLVHLREYFKLNLDDVYFNFQWFHFDAGYKFPIHRDNMGWKTNAPQWIKDRAQVDNTDMTPEQWYTYVVGDGPEVSVNVGLDNDNQPVMFTKDQFELVKSDQDDGYIYDAGLFNNGWGHYVTDEDLNDKDRLIFKITLYRSNFWDMKEKYKLLGL